MGPESKLEDEEIPEGELDEEYTVVDLSSGGIVCPGKSQRAHWT